MNKLTKIADFIDTHQSEMHLITASVCAIAATALITSYTVEAKYLKKATALGLLQEFYSK